jgi:branched-chain amino acid transport system ATP-binding protein
MMVSFAIQGLTGGYGKLPVFRDVDLSIVSGETVGIFGPNGAGKTTLLSTIVGLLPAFSGTVHLDGEDLSRLPAYKRARKKVALVPEGRQVLGTLTVRDNMDLTRTACPGDSTVDFDNHLTEVFALFPRLKERQRQLSGTLSGGEQQMLAVARALLIDPKVLMLDEPTQGLAPVIIQEMISALKQLKGKFSMIIVEQNKAFLEALSDRTFLMRAGGCEPQISP